MPPNWSKLLCNQGDPIEREGCNKYQLHERFPRYCELWGRYAYPNRSSEDPSKFRESFPVALEDFFNNHYGVWYHITTAYRQIDALKQSNAAVEIGDPLFHLATAIDLTERTFVIALIINHEIHIVKREEQEIHDKIRGWYADSKRGYNRSFGDWEKKLKPVSVSIHSVSNEFRENAPSEAYRGFEALSNKIRHYRNIVAHSLPPLRVVRESDKIFIPKEEHLHLYDVGRWSSVRKHYNPQHFELAEIVIENLTRRIVEHVDDLWVSLLEKMSNIASSDTYKEWFSSGIGGCYGEIFNFGPETDWKTGPESGQYQPDEQSTTNTTRANNAGSIESRPDNHPWIPPPPDKPSAYTED